MCLIEKKYEKKEIESNMVKSKKCWLFSQYDRSRLNSNIPNLKCKHFFKNNIASFAVKKSLECNGSIDLQTILQPIILDYKLGLNVIYLNFPSFKSRSFQLHSGVVQFEKFAIFFKISWFDSIFFFWKKPAKKTIVFHFISARHFSLKIFIR